jgi:hypothetical protein
MKAGPVLLSLTLLTACQSGSSDTQKPFSAGHLTGAYEQSKALVRTRYDGKEITVRGYTPSGPAMPLTAADQGSVFLEEKGQHPVRQVNCLFSQEQATEFSKIKGDQYLIVKGVFNGEAGVQLKFCKLLKIE